MSTIGLIAATFVGVVALVIGKVILDLIGKEIEGRLPGLCFAVLRLARRRLPAELRAELHDEALLEEELRTILFHTYHEKPITSLINGFTFAFGCLAGARRNARAAGWIPRHNHQPGRFALALENPVPRVAQLAPVHLTDRTGPSQSDGNTHFLAQPMMFTALALTWSSHSPTQLRTGD
jgi:hypothetical protein